MSYEEIRSHLATTYGWTFPEIDSMSFEQISSSLSDGKKKGIPVYSDEDVRRIARDWRKYYGI